MRVAKAISSGVCLGLAGFRDGFWAEVGWAEWVVWEEEGIGMEGLEDELWSVCSGIVFGVMRGMVQLSSETSIDTWWMGRSGDTLASGSDVREPYRVRSW